ncbi:MAG: hypothetical protein IT538_03510 [Variibacter sp.]|nr:hypothetical protein [Variibacter sp.]
MGRFALLLAAAVMLYGTAQAQTCRNYHQWAKNTFGASIHSLHVAEDQVLRRYMGRSDPPYGELARSVQRIGEAIARGHVTEMERSLRGCRNFVPPYRRVCAAAAFGLLAVISEISAGDLSEATRMAFAERMERCETWLGLPRRSSLLRMP